jgi:hypothetical protein
LNLDPAQAKTGPDLGTYASADDKIYQSDDNNVDVIDAKTRTIQKVFTPLSADATTKDIYYDQAHHLLWVGTSDPKVLAIDPDTGKVVYTVKTASGMDQLAADTDDGLLFLGESKAGVMGVVDLATHENIADVKTESGFHTEGYLPGAHLAYAYLNQSNKTVDLDGLHRWHRRRLHAAGALPQRHATGRGGADHRSGRRGVGLRAPAAVTASRRQALKHLAVAS